MYRIFYTQKRKKKHEERLGARFTNRLCQRKPIFSKCFEKLIRDYICSVLPASLDLLQLAYCSNCSTDDAIAFTLHTALSHLENKNTYVRMLFVDYSSAFNTIVAATLVLRSSRLWVLRDICAAGSWTS